MRGYVIGFIAIVAFSLIVLSIRPGGLRQQLRFVARRFRIVLALGGAWVFGSLILRLAFANGPVVDYGPVVLAVVVGGIFMFVGRDPDTPG